MILYSRSSAQRRSTFRIITTIEKSADGLIVRKRPLTDDAKDHVLKLMANYEKLVSRDLPFKIANPTRIGDSVTIPYVHGTNLASLSQKLLLEGRYADALSIIDSFITMLGQIPQTEKDLTKSVGFMEVFGDSYAKKDQLCFNIGFIDFNLDNFILMPDGSYVLIDYEWEFDFTIPVDLAISRLLFYLFSSIGDSFKLLATEENPIISIGDSLFLPEVIYKHYKHYFYSMAQMLKAEENFSYYVTYTAQKPTQDYEKHTLIKMHMKPLFPSVINELDEYEREISSLKIHATHLKEKNELMESELKELQRNHEKLINQPLIRAILRLRSVIKGLLS